MNEQTAFFQFGAVGVGGYLLLIILRETYAFIRSMRYPQQAAAPTVPVVVAPVAPDASGARSTEFWIGSIREIMDDRFVAALGPMMKLLEEIRNDGREMKEEFSAFLAVEKDRRRHKGR